MLRDCFHSTDRYDFKFKSQIIVNQLANMEKNLSEAQDATTVNQESISGTVRKTPVFIRSNQR